MKLAENFAIILYPELKELTSEGKEPVYVRITITGFPRKEFSTRIKVISDLFKKKTWQIDRVNFQIQYLLLTI